MGSRGWAEFCLSCGEGIVFYEPMALYSSHTDSQIYVIWSLRNSARKYKYSNFTDELRQKQEDPKTIYIRTQFWCAPSFTIISSSSVCWREMEWNSCLPRLTTVDAPMMKQSVDQFWKNQKNWIMNHENSNEKRNLQNTTAFFWARLCTMAMPENQAWN